MKATLRKYGILLATFLSVAFSFNYTNAQITGASAVCVNGTTTLVAPSTAISGGTITNVSGYNVHTFTGAGTFVIPAGLNINTELLVVAGGGGGGYRHAGGGGAGGLIYNAAYSTSGSQSVVVGAGGLGSLIGTVNGTNGANSSFGSVVAIGGGAGGTNNLQANNGGSGGGGSNGSFGGTGVVGQGFAGGNQNNGGGCCYAMGNGGGGATGAGASTAGLLGSNGGPGFTTSMTGISQSFAGGGGGGQGVVTSANYIGGIGGGGQGGNTVNMQGANGTPNTGGGGGGGGANNTVSGNGGDGGSGIVIVKYAQAGAGTWTSSNTAVATVNASTGAVTGVSAGTATITYLVTVGGVVNNYTKVITVSGLPIASIKANGPLTFCAGGSVGLSAATSALQFNGTNSVTVANGYAATDDITYEATVTPTALSGFNVIMNHDNYNTGAIHYQFVNGQLQFSVAGNAPNDQYCTAAFATNTTYRVAAVYSKAGKYVKFYVNGVLINTANYTSTVSIIGNNSYTIGAWGGGRFFQGTIDDIRVWNVQRTDAQVLSDAAAMPIATGTANLIRYYRFDEGTGTTTSDDAGGATGTLVGSLAWVSTTPVGQTYLWSNGSTATSITATSAGIYSVTVTSATGCQSVSETKTVKVNAVPAASIVASGATTFCANASVTLTANGAAGNALQLSGANYAEIVNNNLPVGTAARTLEAWVKTTQTSSGAIANWGIISTGQRFGLLVISGKLYFVGQNVDMIGNITINDGVWHHVAVTYDGVTVNTYVDGVLDRTGNLGLNTSGTTLRIGQRSIGDNQNELFVGQIDEVRVWNIAKTITQIQATQKLSVASNSANLVAYYKMDEASGATIADASSNAVTANLISSPTFAASGADIRYSTYAWSNSATTNAISVNTTGNYAYTATTANGCSVTAAATTVTVNPLPTATVATSAINVCINTGAPLVTFTGANGTAPYTFTYSINAGAQQTVTSTGNIATVSAPTGVVGTFTYTLLSVKDASTTTCSNTITGSSIVVVVRAIPTISAVTGTTSICAGNATTLTAASAFIGAQYKWYDAATGGNLLANGATYTTAVLSNSTNYYVELTATPFVCAATRTLVTVTVNALPIATITASGATTVCPSSAVSLNANTGTGYNYQWSKNAVSISSATLSTYNATTTGSYTVVITSASGCVSAVSNVINVTVQDITAPIISNVPTNISANATSASGAVVTYTLPTATDNCTTSPTVTAVPASGSVFPIGTTLVTVTATDATGNNTQATFNITVSGLAPVIVVPANFDVNTTVGACTAIVNFAVTETTGIPASTITYTEYGIPTYSGYMNDVGTHTITATATNAIGSSSNTFTFTVHDVTPPQFTSTATILTANVGGVVQATSLAGAVVNFTLPAATDNCANAYVTAVPYSGSVFPLGETTVVVTASDPSGNSSQTSFTVTVVGVAPSIVVPSTVTVNNKAGLCNAIVNFAATDPTGVPASTITYDIQPGSVFNVGTTKVTATATNEFGSSSLSFDVVVKDTELPKVFTKDPTIYLDANGQATLTVAQVDNGSTDNCAITNKTISKTLFNCSDLVKAVPNVSALKFNGSGIAYIPSLIPGGNNFSFSSWFYANDASNGKIISSGAFEICLCGNGIEVFTPYGGGFGAPGISLNKWHNIIVTFSFPLAKVYIDGNLSFSFNTSPIGGISGAVLGRHVNGCCPLIGTLDEMSFWKITLSASQIAAMQTRALKGDEAGLTAYYNFDEGTGTTIIDRSGNHHNAIMQSMLTPWTTVAAPITTSASNTVILSVTDASGNIATGTAVVTVLDAIAPTITCQDNVNAVATSAAGAVVNYTTPVGTDNCSATTAMVAGLVSGSVFPIGTTIVTYRATDASGNKTDCSFTVTVAGIAPVIVKPADISVASPVGECGANVNFAATETTGIPASIITYTEDGSEVVSGANFSVGVHTITATATNAVGSSSVDFTITVIDDQLPTIIAPADITINNTEGHCGAINVRLGWPEVADNCSVADYYPDYHQEFPVGTTDVTWTVVDASGNTATAIQHVTVIDNEKPVLQRAHDWGREGATAEPGKCGTSDIASLHLGVPGTASTFTISENCGIATITSNAPAFFPVGLTIVTYTVTDIHGNFSTIDEEVTVSDFEPPVIAAVADINVNATSAAGAVVNYTAPIGTDNCSAATTVMTAGLESGATFPIGTTVVTYIVTDATGLTASTSFNVTVTGLAPVIVTPGDIVVNNDLGMNGAVVSFAATETTAIPASTITYSTAPGSFFTVGTHTVTATASNAVGSSSVDFNVIVVDHEKPTIATAADIAVNNDENACAAIVTTTVPAASDNTSIESVTGVRADGLLLTDAYPVGSTVITWTAKDVNGNSNSSTQTITVTDNQLPTITAPASVTVTANAGLCAASNVNLGSPITGDNCAVATVTNDAPTSFFVGATTVTWTVTDIHGNVSTATQTVTVTDDELPVIVNTPINITKSNDQGNCGAIVSWTAATATDNCPGVTISSDHQSGEAFPVGTTTVTYTATDAHGHTVTSSFTITVNDTELPTITSSDKTQTADAGVCNATVTVASPVTSDNCAVQSVTNSINGTNNASGVYPVGTTQITWTVTDIHGNVNTTVQNITVNDDEKPVAKTQNIIIQLNASGVANITAAQINNGSTDNCGITSITLDKTSFYCSNVGANTVTLTVTDIHGNTSTATAVVTVQDKVAPIAKAKNITVGLGTAVGGLVNITAADVNNGSTDACGIASMTVVPASFGCSKVGANTVTLTVTDVNGNVSTTTAIVTIVDDKGPVPTIATLSTITGQCYATLLTMKAGEHEEDHDGDDNRIDLEHYTLIAPTAMDNCSGLIKGTTTDALTYYNQGTYIIHWKFVDAKGNVTIQEQTVIVKDTQAPTPKRATLPTLTGQCSVNVASGSNSDDDGDDNDGGDDDHGKTPWAKDNCSGWIKGTTTDPLTYSVQGTYTITWSFNDGHGNISTQTQTVIVKDITKPKINAPKDKSIACGSSILPAVTGMATATDNCSTPVITFTDVNANNLITRTWKATDAAGNTSTDVQLIKLTPAFTATVSSTPTSTVYTGGSNTNLYLGYGAQSTALSVTGLPAGNYTYTWSGGNLNNANSATPVFTPTAAGVTTFYVIVTNANGCSSSASISICVTDVRVAGSNGALVYVCHQGTGKTGGTQTLQVPVAQVASHLTNSCGGKGGDRLGSCSSNPCNSSTTSAIDPITQDLIELKTIKAETTAAPVEDLKVTVMPNPSTTYFTLKFASKDLKTAINLRVMDASGRAIDSKQQIDPSSTIQIGYNYPSGTFYAEVIQGNKRKVVQLIKARG